jgi:hypothetical protein
MENDMLRRKKDRYDESYSLPKPVNALSIHIPLNYEGKNEYSNPFPKSYDEHHTLCH